MAVSQDGEFMAITNSLDHSLTITRMTGEDQSEVTVGGYGNGPGQLNYPRKCCFGPNGNILVVESGCTRVQQFTTSGEHVRCMPLSDSLSGIAADSRHIVVSCGCWSTTRIWVLDWVTGTFLRTIGSPFLSGCSGVRISPDGAHVLATDIENSRLVLFTLDGTLLRYLSCRSPC